MSKLRKSHKLHRVSPNLKKKYGEEIVMINSIRQLTCELQSEKEKNSQTVKNFFIDIKIRLKNITLSMGVFI